MLEIDLVLFQALNADAATLPAVVTVARWVSQQLPTAMGGLLLGSLVLGNAAQRRALALALASMALPGWECNCCGWPYRRRDLRNWALACSGSSTRRAQAFPACMWQAPPHWRPASHCGRSAG